VTYVPPTGENSFGNVAYNGESHAIWGDTSAGSYSYTLAASDIGKNFYFRATTYACDTPGAQTVKITQSINDGTGTFIHNGVTTTSVSSNFDDVNNATVMIAASADSTPKAATQKWTWTVTAVTATVKCSFYADLLTYGSIILSTKVGLNGNPGPVQDAWVPCCDSVQSSFQVVMNDQPHQYLEVVATSTGGGGFDTLKLTNPGSIIGLTDVATFPTSTHIGTVSARTCLSNQSCEVLAANYFVELVNHGIAYNEQASDFHATFTLTTKAGVASASATIALAVAALFALFH